MDDDVVVAFVTRSTGVGDLRAARGVPSSSCIGSGGMSTDGRTGLLGLDRDLDREVGGKRVKTVEAPGRTALKRTPKKQLVERLRYSDESKSSAQQLW